MKKSFLILPVVLLLAAGCNSSTPATSQQPSAGTPPSSQVQGASTTSTKFSDQSYYQNSYLISGDTLSSDAQKALTGFDMSKQTLKDGSTQITLKALNSEYKDQQYTLQPGQQLYFIEKFLADDNQEAKEDRTVKDDMAIVVDAQGNIVGQPGGWSQ